MTSTAVVILNYNGEKFLTQFLPSVILNSQSAEVIVADNGSTDQSIAILQKDFPSVRIIRLGENFGFCGGYNRALREVTADYYVLLNSDIEVTPGWLDPMVRLLDSNRDIQAVQPKVLSFRERNWFEYAGAAGGFIDMLGYPFCRGRIFDHTEPDTGQFNDEREVFWATGACLMIRSETYKKFGGLDEDLFAHMEEIDLCWKIARSGGKIYYSGKSTIYHVGGGTLGHGSPRKTYLNFRNGLILIYKHLDPGELYIKLPFRLILDWVASLTFLLKGKPGHALSVWKAHISFFKDLGVHRKKRQELRGSYPEYPRTNIHQGLIIFEYYLKGKRSIVPQ